MAVNTEKNIIPEPTLRRLPWYLAFARLSKAKGESVLSSTQIAHGVGVGSAIVAKDLSYIAVTGRTRVGYDVTELIDYLDMFLGFGNTHKAFLFGVGKLGRALLQDSGLQQYGLDIVAGFDNKHELSGININTIPIHHIDYFSKLQELMHVEIGVLTVPVNVAQQTAELLVDNGVKAIWNFTPMRIKVPKHIVVQNTSIYAHLALIYNRLAEFCQQHKDKK